MCGFLGYILNKNTWENSQKISDDLENISKKIKHRGPDDKSFLIDETNKLALVFQRLSILDLSKNAMQPMVSKCKSWVIVFNGEIYNFKDLRNFISEKSGVWKTNSDTEVILECIAKYGFSHTISILDGMFAIAAYCRKDKTLWLARDKFGEKPLYYSKDELDNFFFSSDIKAFMASKYFKKKIDYSVSAEYLRYGYVPDPLCILDNTHKLGPGMILKFNKNKAVRTDQYWNTFNEFTKMRKELFKGTYNDAIQEIKFRIRNATKTRLISDVPVGAFLSGGIDSSNLVLSLKKDGINLDTFSIGFEDEFKNEADYAEEVSSSLDTNHYEKILNSDDCINIIPMITKYYDEPFSDPSQIPTFLLSKFARKKVKVAISGDGADELFGGYPRYKKISRFWNKLENSPQVILKNLAGLSFYLSSSKSKLLRSFGKKIRKLSHSNLESLYNDELSRWRPDEGLYNIENNAESNFNKVFKFDRGLISNFRYLMLRDLNTYLPSNLLVKIDRASMANSLEVRSPYLDPSLVKCIWSLPDHYLYRNNMDKSILRDILAERFTKNIYARKKQGFEPPLNTWLKGPLRDWAYQIISENDDIINTKTLKYFFERFINGEKKLTYKLWSLIMFKAWRKENLI